MRVQRLEIAIPFDLKREKQKKGGGRGRKGEISEKAVTEMNDDDRPSRFIENVSISINDQRDLDLSKG